MKPPTAFEIDIEVRDHKLKKLVVVRRKGRLFNVDGKSVLVFPVRVFAEAVDRSWKTLVRWEKCGALPRPVWRVEGEKAQRLYTKAQILMANEVWRKHRDRGKGRHLDIDGFLKELRERFYVDFHEKKEE